MKKKVKTTYNLKRHISSNFFYLSKSNTSSMVQLLFNHKIQIGESYIGRLFAVIKKKLGIRDACIRILPVPDRTASIGGGGAVIRGYFFLFFSFRAWREPWAPFGRS